MKTNGGNTKQYRILSHPICSGLVLALVLMLCLVGLVYAAADGYGLNWFSVDSGGGVSQGGSYSLSGTIGQPDAGQLQSEIYTLSGGLWSGELTEEKIYLLYLPTIRN